MDQVPGTPLADIVQLGSIPSSLGGDVSSTLAVRSIPSSLAQAVVVEKHYLHRRAACSSAFGLFQANQLLGVAMFGSPVSSTLCRGVCGPALADEVIELVRLWCDDALPKGTETWFLARALPRITKNIIIAFADPSVGHLGIVYQAATFIYTGLGPMRKRWFNPNTPGKHLHRSLGKYDRARLLALGFLYIPAVRKHRYIYLNASPRRRRWLETQLRYPRLPFPKGVMQ